MIIKPFLLSSYTTDVETGRFNIPSGVLAKKLEGIRARIYENDYCVFSGIKTYQILSLKTTLASLANI